ncbi:MAG: hypothetical protein GWM92_11260, partial [Gemmatimonadetes bacterium]|nr:hypothetical protein [Gemmatimonadota bacterium]NIR77830.1 hypothetical protein [Gemmatimonadota bacterium]NIT87930.1 hypothetical protein [Gemmatimonadota bacterium]NIU31787.1 hypothetical protein [Gemmatimonadota bacterium]NIU35120.1 hypothetical protein [Gemmatimonadota bacterium]
VSPVTFFEAPSSRARFYNNVTWNSNVSASRSITDQADQPLDSTFSQ